MKEYQMTDTSLGTVDVSKLEPMDQDTSNIMKSEFKTGLGLSSIYYVFIFFIPVINWFFKDFAFNRIWGGMTFTWFLTTIVGMVMAFAIAAIHTKKYESRLELYQPASSSNENKDSIKGGNTA
ncbi:uncharacterized membrane protein (DUF485 family) [Bacillus ectoiniformans]|uniref:hypothetical protein n=1 Tax=Bacillus ectoiniformans TaxID=1494429 RepID=UPI00195C555D|nr:hypothetical protein [Bacillus ectoiniformans]MBM7647358.1 uncharacterized membrane protein (DUF485 family) [Bacillus ectoiniformans]